MSDVWMSHVTRMNESRHTYEWVTSHVWMSHVRHMNESCCTYHSVTPHLRINQISHVRQLSQSCHTYEWVMSYMTLSHITITLSLATHRNESRRTIWMGHLIVLNSYTWVISSFMWTIVTDSDFFLDWVMIVSYGVASISRLLKMIGLFFRI